MSGVGPRCEPHVILLAGPGGSGKSSTAARIAEHPDWVHLSEDRYWVSIKAGRTGELRTPEEQAVVQQQVSEQLLRLLGSKKVVLEFILYEDPPLPLLRYQELLAGNNIPFMTRVLRPSVDEVLRRMQARGRPNDTNAGPARLRAHAENQVRILGSHHIHREWVLDTTDLSLAEVYERHFRSTIERRGEGDS